MAEESPTREDLAEGLPERIGKYKPLSQLGVGGKEDLSAGGRIRFMRLLNIQHRMSNIQFPSEREKRISGLRLQIHDLLPLDHWKFPAIAGLDIGY